jgi:pilus assembly protein Flp/PilA
MNANRQTRIATLMRELRQDERGATMVEYGLIIGLVAVVVVGGVVGLGPIVSAFFTGVPAGL